MASSAAAIWKYNVHPKHLSAVVDEQMFGENGRHNVAPGDLVLLQQLKYEAQDPHGRISHVLIVHSHEEDSLGESERVWGTRFKYLLKGQVVELAQPFSLEDLGLSRSYSKQGAQSPERIAGLDESVVLEAVGDLS